MEIYRLKKFHSAVFFFYHFCTCVPFLLLNNFLPQKSSVTGSVFEILASWIREFLTCVVRKIVLCTREGSPQSPKLPGIHVGLHCNASEKN